MADEEVFKSTAEALLIMAHRRGLSRHVALAKKAGLSQVAVSRYINGQGIPSRLATINKLAAALEVTPQWLEGHVQRDLAAQALGKF